MKSDSKYRDDHVDTSIESSQHNPWSLLLSNTLNDVISRIWNKMPLKLFLNWWGKETMRRIHLEEIHYNAQTYLVCHDLSSHPVLCLSFFPVPPVFSHGLNSLVPCLFLWVFVLFFLLSVIAVIFRCLYSRDHHSCCYSNLFVEHTALYLLTCSMSELSFGLV